MQMRTQAGVVELTVIYGQDPQDRHWGCPMRELWALTPHQQLSLALEDKLAFTVTATGSYEEAAALSGNWHSSKNGADPKEKSSQKSRAILSAIEAGSITRR